MTGGIEIITEPEMSFCDPWLEKKYNLFRLLYKLGLKNCYGCSGYSCGKKGTWYQVW